MKPTMNLRFIERLTKTEFGNTIKVLQQWWEEDGGDYDGLGEWRDVPLENEK